MSEKIAIVGTGGTFAMEARHAFDWVEYGEGGVVRPIADLLDGATAGLDVALQPVDFRALGSTGITLSDWIDLARLVATIEVGCVITHGTATLEETAFFLSLVHRGDRPVVLTGAQRPANSAGSDALPNLRSAIAVAASPVARGAGVLVVIDNMIFAARDVTKESSGALDAFVAPEFGPLGRVEADGSVRFRRVAPPSAPAIDLTRAIAPSAVTLPRVDIAYSYAGADGTAIDAFVAAGARGIVSAGLLPGRPANGEARALAAAAAAGLFVIQGTRGGRGNVVPQAFLDRAGMIAGGDLSPQKLRIVAMLVLSAGGSLSDLRDVIGTI
ncbi:L-asparaginase [Sphingobium sp. AP50]|uniref:asparaginase n=1 Tax=Sphingobium sp. AP50 TaxID=1884369 RepID=UPI0008BA7505|nr:asparaginase [Sphingobium sp. AP50]SEK00772.1 L-asparaginase [Sphingobium sp. AP50]